VTTEDFGIKKQNKTKKTSWLCFFWDSLKMWLKSSTWPPANRNPNPLSVHLTLCRNPLPSVTSGAIVPLKCHRGVSLWETRKIPAQPKSTCQSAAAGETAELNLSLHSHISNMTTPETWRRPRESVKVGC